MDLRGSEYPTSANTANGAKTGNFFKIKKNKRNLVPMGRGRLAFRNQGMALVANRRNELGSAKHP